MNEKYCRGYPDRCNYCSIMSCSYNEANFIPLELEAKFQETSEFVSGTKYEIHRYPKEN